MSSPRPIAMLLAACLLTAAVAVGAQEVIDNGEQPAQGVVTAGMRELWRLGGEDEDLFFGTVARITQDENGNFYLLDGQLSEAHIISPEGEHIATVGGEGDGPGEMRQPGDMFLTPDGNINCLTGFPGKVVSLTPDGIPAGTVELKDMPFGVLIRGLAGDQGLVLGGIRMEFGGGSVSKQNYFLAHYDMEGNPLGTLVAKTNSIDYADLEMTESAMDFVWRRIDLGPDSRLYVAEDRDVYSIKVMDLAGNVEKIINRRIEVPERTERQKEIANQIIDAVAGYYPAPLKRKSIQDSEAVVDNLTVTRDGRIWNTPPVAADQLPAGTWTMMDVFDADGRFEKQVALEGDFNRYRDAALVMPDGKLIVVTGALDAFLNQMNAAGGSAGEVDPLEVICFELEM